MGDHGRIGRALLAHYDRYARDLPWRRRSDPYAVWVSEIMLQQTRVSTAIPYFERWMDRFPTVDALAAAEVEDVLESWAGLGYYSRARNLHRAASMVRERFSGRIPDSLAELKQLPGIGDYTAGAVASIAFGRREPAVDGNVRRVLARLFDLETTSPAKLRALALDLQDPGRPGDFNQALMELGATVCTPQSPRCDVCPLDACCLSRARDTIHERPGRKPRAPVREVAFASFVIVDPTGRTLLVQRPAKGLLGGMWEFPATAVDESAGWSERFDLVLDPVRHQFTHLHATYHPVVLPGPAAAATLERAAALDLGDRPLRVKPLDELRGLAIPVGQLKIAAKVLAAAATAPSA